jgi:hypothetical protein
MRCGRTGSLPGGAGGARAAPGRDGEVKGQLGDAKQARDPGERLNGALHVRLDEAMQRTFQRDEPVGVTVGVRRVRAD